MDEKFHPYNCERHNKDTQTQGNNEPLAGTSWILDDVQPNQASTNESLPSETEKKG